MILNKLTTSLIVFLMSTHALLADDLLYSDDSSVRIAELKKLASASSAEDALTSLSRIGKRYGVDGSGLSEIATDEDLLEDQQIKKTIYQLGEKYEQIYEALFTIMYEADTQDRREKDVDLEKVFLASFFTEVAFDIAKLYPQKTLSLLHSKSKIKRGIALSFMLENPLDEFTMDVTAIILELLLQGKNIPRVTLERITGDSANKELWERHLVPNSHLVFRVLNNSLISIASELAPGIKNPELLNEKLVIKFTMFFHLYAKLISFWRVHSNKNMKKEVLELHFNVLKDFFSTIRPALAEASQHKDKRYLGQLNDGLLEDIQYAKTGYPPKLDLLSEAETLKDEMIHLDKSLSNAGHFLVNILSARFKYLLDYLTNLDPRDTENILKELHSKLSTGTLSHLKAELEQDHGAKFVEVFRMAPDCEGFFSQG